MTKEDMILYAEFMVSCDVSATPLGGSEVGNLIPDEAWEVWIEGLIMKHNCKKVCVLPDKSKGEMKVRTFIMNENGDLFDYDWIPTDEELVAELKKQDFCFPFAEPGELKYIIVSKFPDALDL